LTSTLSSAMSRPRGSGLSDPSASGSLSAATSETTSESTSDSTSGSGSTTTGVDLVTDDRIRLGRDALVILGSGVDLISRETASTGWGTGSLIGGAGSAGGRTFSARGDTVPVGEGILSIWVTSDSDEVTCLSGSF
jgi:hypothetical protein